MFIMLALVTHIYIDTGFQSEINITPSHYD
jgi:hypothetical protein